jgi:CMP-N-acetylneuraminic acid synthetase
MKVLGIIPARGGSKGIPRKNLAPLNGRPLLAYTAESALAARRLCRVVLSTEDLEIADVGKRYGLEVPFLRSHDLARDETPTLPVAQDVVKRLEEQGDFYDAVCLLQPTNPFRRAEHIDGCVELLVTTQADAVVSMLPVPSEYNPHWAYVRDEQGLIRLFTGAATPISRRQDLPKIYHREGSVYVTRRNVLMLENSLYGSRTVGYLMESNNCVNIDGWEDLSRAENLVGLGRDA